MLRTTDRLGRWIVSLASLLLVTGAAACGFNGGVISPAGKPPEPAAVQTRTPAPTFTPGEPTTAPPISEPVDALPPASDTPEATATETWPPDPEEPEATSTRNPPASTATRRAGETPRPTETAQPSATKTRLPAATHTPVIVEWRGEYYANPNLAGAPAVVRNDGEVNFDWGNAAPATGLPADGFSARWTRLLPFADGLYRFRALIDDGLRVYLDGNLILDAWRDGRLREAAADYRLRAGNHSMRIEYYERSGEAVAAVWWERVQPASFSGWKSEYWTNRKLDGTPALVRDDDAIDFDWHTSAPAAELPADNFSIRWSRRVSFDSGTYRFYARADDGIRFYLDDELVLDEWHSADAEDVYVVERGLSGKHRLVVEYYERSGGARAEFWWKRTGAVPTATFTPTRIPVSSPVPSATPVTPTATATKTAVHPATATRTPAPTSTRTSGPTVTPVTATATPESTRTAVPPTAPATATATPEATQTPAPARTRVPRPTATLAASRVDVRINEVLPRPGHTDWDNDGVADYRDEWIEVYNRGPAAIDLGGWFLDDAEGNSPPYHIPRGTQIEPQGFKVFFHRQTGIVLPDGGGEVRLLEGDGKVRTSVTFGNLAPDVSYSRSAAGTWYADRQPSPGALNAPPVVELPAHAGGVTR